ncbi:MAG TPA: GNAT family N-acetyltransferase [Fimbriimonadaceae bacterium]|nr:GNAT family N-acetyltransferase [Fimbriimonadaceae bacterium]
MSFEVRAMCPGDIAGAVALQRACFPPPFPAELLWKPEHLQRHLEIFPEGQLVAVLEAGVIGSASSLILAEEHYQMHLDWEQTVGGHFLGAHDPSGSTLYGVDISVHPAHRGKGVAKALYLQRYALVLRLGLRRYATACRLPGYRLWLTARAEPASVEAYVEEVAAGRAQDPTLTPLLKMGLRPVGVIRDHMEDEESGHAAAALEWCP